MLRKIRIAAAALFFGLITLLFLDFSGTLHTWFGWMARIQLLPALLAVNAVVVAVLVVLTLVFGRIYCSIVCPLGVMQDIVSRVSSRQKKNRFAYSPARSWLRWGVLAVFVVAMVAGAGKAAALIAPYSAYGRIASTLLAPLWLWGNNLLAWGAERLDSYAFYPVEVWLKSGAALAVAVVTFCVIALLAWRNGRTWCNTVCPVGTVLGVLSRFSLYKVRIDPSKCNGCKRCARNCKASCIDPQSHRIDYSRCVACMNCLDNCRQGAVGFTLRRSAAHAEPKALDPARRRFFGLLGVFAYTALRAQEMKVDGGLALIEEKKIPERNTPITPPGSLGARNLAAHCTGCQLCISVCPNRVLRPSGRLTTLMQPDVSYERGYCRPECTRCSEVCPTGAIRRITAAEKSATQIGHAVWIRENCVVLNDGVSCDNCARHCPAAAIHLVPIDPSDPGSLRIPVVNEERCIGCGACENLCPARPFSAIYVEGHSRHRTI
ncbi:4Fe-4S binding protein [Alistipes sp.]|uniref:4Fe-4S binding protein n=1 Tax=Alistipes sp. TaxID=1872444 RepID=UPI003AF02F50